MVQMAPIPVFYLGGIRLNKNTAALSDRLCYFCRIFGKDIFIPSKKYGRNKYIYGHAVFLSLLPLLVYKIGGLRGYSVFGFLGISYICFKIIQVVIECYDGVINEIDEFQFIEF